jgi:hypothetical protein
MTYLAYLQRPTAPTPSDHGPVRTTSYLSQLQPTPAAPLPEGALAGSTSFALTYNILLPHRHRLTIRPQSHRPLLDGEPLAHDRLIALTRLVQGAGVDASIDTIQRAATAHAFATPAADPWLSALRGWLAHEVVNNVWLRRTNPAGYDEGPIANLSFAARDGHGDGSARTPYWFVSTRDIKAELNAYGPEAMRRIRAAMKTLGWKERKCFVWGGRQWGFVRPTIK